MERSNMDFSNDLLFQDVYRRRIGDKYGKSCCIFATTLTIFNMILYGTVFILSDILYKKESGEFDEFVEGTFLQNATETRIILEKFPKIIDAICEEIGC